MLSITNTIRKISQISYRRPIFSNLSSVYSAQEHVSESDAQKGFSDATDLNKYVCPHCRAEMYAGHGEYVEGTDGRI